LFKKKFTKVSGNFQKVQQSYRTFQKKSGKVFGNFKKIPASSSTILKNFQPDARSGRPNDPLQE
jgi:hypothetical protein